MYKFLCTLIWLFCFMPSTIFSAGCTYEKHPDVSAAVWQSASPYFLPSDHPIKNKMDEIFSKSRVIASSKAIKEAGFTLEEDKEQDLIVARHPEMPGYVIKLYYDNHDICGIYDKIGEIEFWMNRIKGIQRAKSAITKNRLEELFVIPYKWIYPLPLTPKAESANDEPVYPKYFVLVVEDMNLVSHKENEELYKTVITPKYLMGLYTIIHDAHFYDSVYIDNNIFTKDGKIAFIDTEDMDRKPILFNKMTPYFSPEMQKVWLEILEARGAEIPARCVPCAN